MRDFAGGWRGGGNRIYSDEPPPGHTYTMAQFPTTSSTLRPPPAGCHFTVIEHHDQVRDTATELQATCTTVELFQIATVTKGDAEKIRSRISNLEAVKDKYALPMSFKAAHDTMNPSTGGYFMGPTGRLLDNGAPGFAANYAEWYPSRLTAEMVPMTLGLVCAMFETLCGRCVGSMAPRIYSRLLCCCLDRLRTSESVFLRKLPCSCAVSCPACVW